MLVVEVELVDGVAVLTINRPGKMNALSRDLRAALAAAIETVGADDSVHVVILTGAGERAFSAGLDLKEVAESGLAQDEYDARQKDPVLALSACSKPVIAAVNGVAVTGGFELALACDILLASRNARFADTHVRVGVMPGWGLSQRLSRLIGISRAKAMSLSGNYVNAETALASGLVNQVFEADELLPAARALAADIAACDPGMVTRYKALIDDGFDLPFADAMTLERERSVAANASVTASSVAQSRVAIQARGRGQTE